MAKKKGGKPARRPQNMDAVLRIKHLYRAAEYLAKLPAPIEGSLEPGAVMKNAGSSHKGFVESAAGHSFDEPRPKKFFAALELSQSYTKIMKGVASKAVVRLEPQVKHSICVKCAGILIPEVTYHGKVIKEKTHKYFGMTCKFCGNMNKLPMGTRPPKKGRK